MRRRTSNESGSVLLWVMVAGLFAVGALGAATRLIPSGAMFTMRDLETTRSFITAESGVNYTAYMVKKHGLGFLDHLDELSASWLPAGFDAQLAGEFQVMRDEEYVYVVGRFGDAQRVLRAKVLKPREKPQPQAPFELDVVVFAVAGSGARFPALKVTGGAEVRETAGTNAVARGAVKLDGGPILGDILVGPVPAGQAESVVDKPNWMQLSGNIIPLAAPRSYPLPPFPEPPAGLSWRGSVETAWNKTRVVIDEAGRYDAIIAGSGDYTVVFDTRGGDLHVRANTVRAHGSGRFEVIGGGRLFLYVDSALKLEGSGTFNANGDRTSVVIYYSGSSTLELGSGTWANGIIHVKSARVNIAGGFQGDVWVFTGGQGVTLAGGASLERSGLVYAPLADVDVTGGARTVMVIGNSVHVSGGAQIYNPTFDVAELAWSWFPTDDSAEQDQEEYVGETLEWHICWDCSDIL